MAGISRLVGLFLAAFILAFLVTMADAYLLHVPSLVWVVALTTAGLLLSFRPGTILSALAAGLAAQAEPDPVRLLRHLAVLDRAHEMAWVSGLLACLLGITQMLGFLEMPGDVAKGISVAAVPLLYGATIAEFVLRPLRCAVASASAATLAKLPVGAPPGLGTRTLVLFGCAVLLAILLLYFVMSRQTMSVYDFTLGPSVPGIRMPNPAG